MSDLQSNENPQNNPPASGDGDGFGWLRFILIYGVRNLIRYNTTGMLLIPIPRK